MNWLLLKVRSIDRYWSDDRFSDFQARVKGAVYRQRRAIRPDISREWSELEKVDRAPRRGVLTVSCTTCRDTIPGRGWPSNRVAQDTHFCNLNRSSGVRFDGHCQNVRGARSDAPKPTKSAPVPIIEDESMIVKFMEDCLRGAGNHRERAAASAPL